MRYYLDGIIMLEIPSVTTHFRFHQRNSQWKSMLTHRKIHRNCDKIKTTLKWKSKFINEDQYITMMEMEMMVLISTCKRSFGNHFPDLVFEILDSSSMMCNQTITTSFIEICSITNFLFFFSTLWLDNNDVFTFNEFAFHCTGRFFT